MRRLMDVIASGRIDTRFRGRRFSGDRPLRRERHGDGPGLLDISWSSDHALLHIEPPAIDHAPVEIRVDPPRARDLPPGLRLTGEALLWQIGRSHVSRCGEGDAYDGNRLAASP
jgi:hypothetical protein